MFSKAVLLLLLIAMLSGCRKDVASEEVPDQDYIGSVSENTIRIDSDGKILEIAVEDYSGVDYNVGELKTYIQKEINAFNKEKGVDKITFLQIRNEGKTVKTAISYSDLSSYNAFNHTDMKLTVYSAETANKNAEKEAPKPEQQEKKKELSEAELAEAGYTADLLEGEEIQSVVEEKAVVASFTDVNGNVITSDAIDVNQNMMLITDEKINVEVEGGKLLYAGNHAKLTDGIAKTDGEGTAIIVLFLGF